MLAFYCLVFEIALNRIILLYVFHIAFKCLDSIPFSFEKKKCNYRWCNSKRREVQLLSNWKWEKRELKPFESHSCIHLHEEKTKKFGCLQTYKMYVTIQFFFFIWRQYIFLLSSCTTHSRDRETTENCK